ncbi:MAG TPA: hypothetical protein PLZ79_03805 [Burkholderiales bacterium]|nr:hypothetical protein [Burkholderiales bacterium]
MVFIAHAGAALAGGGGGLGSGFCSGVGRGEGGLFAGAVGDGAEMVSDSGTRANS